VRENDSPHNETMSVDFRGLGKVNDQNKIPMPIRDFQDLIVWQKSVDLAEELYRLTRSFPPEERYGLVSQIRRAGVSVSSNIAEGSGRGTTRDLVSFLTNSRGSLFESRSLLVVSQRVELLTPAECVSALGLMEEVGKMLSRLRTNLKTKHRRTTRH
jgi:four helix bundle protein